MTKMTKKPLVILLIITTLFSNEIQLEKKSNLYKESPKAEVNVSFTRDDAKELVVNNTTGMMWQDNIDAKTIKKNRKDARQHCKDLVFAGYDDWYLPKIKQLESIVDHKNRNPAIRAEFKNVESFHYWSSSPSLRANIINVLNVDFKSGHTYRNNRKGRCYVRCVRGKYKR